MNLHAHTHIHKYIKKRFISYIQHAVACEELACVDILIINSVQFSHSVISDSLQPHGLQHTRLPCYHQFLGLTQTQIHQVGDAIQPSHPLPFLSSPAFYLSKHQGLFH